MPLERLKKRFLPLIVLDARTYTVSLFLPLDFKFKNGAWRNKIETWKKKKKAKGFLSTFKVSWQPSFILLEPKKKKSISFEDLCPCSVCSLRICIAVVSRLEDIGKEKKAPVIHHGPFIVWVSAFFPSCLLQFSSQSSQIAAACISSGLLVVFSDGAR